MSTPVATAEPPVLPPTWSERRDFPGWLPAVLVKELRQSLRTRGFVGSVILYQVIMAIGLVWAMSEADLGRDRGAFAAINGFYWFLLSVLVAVTTPWRGLTALRDEIEQRSLDLLVLTRLSAARIVLGKWGSLAVQALLLLLTTLPYGVLRYFFGSVNLLEDLASLAGLLFLSMVLSALALWVSTLPRFFRVLLPVGVIFFLNTGRFWSRTIAPLLFGRGFGVPAASPGIYEQFALFLAGSVLIALFLMFAIQRLAPPAENHSLRFRLGGLAVLFGGFGLVAWRGVPATGELVFALAVLGLVLANELSFARRPLRVHVPGWLRGHASGRLFARLLLPGWPSAALFAALCCALIGIFVAGSGLWARVPVGRVVWCCVLGWGMLVFPALLLSWLPARSVLRSGNAGYFVVQGLFGIVSLVLATGALQTFSHYRLVLWLDTFSRMLPVSGFWTTLAVMGDRPLSTTEIAGQTATLALVLYFLWKQTAGYRAEVYLFMEDIGRDSGPAAP